MRTRLDRSDRLDIRGLLLISLLWLCIQRWLGRKKGLEILDGGDQSSTFRLGSPTIKRREVMHTAREIKMVGRTDEHILGRNYIDQWRLLSRKASGKPKSNRDMIGYSTVCYREEAMDTEEELGAAVVVGVDIGAGAESGDGGEQGRDEGVDELGIGIESLGLVGQPAQCRAGHGRGTGNVTGV